MEIVTGYVGQPHIESDDIQSLIRGLVGNNLYILDTASHLTAELTDANTVTISAGDLVFAGVHARIPYGSTDQITIANGSSGFNRVDVIAVRYERDASTGEESMSWVYYQGGTDGEAPAVTDGDIEEGDMVAEAVVFRIEFDAMTPELVHMIDATPNLGDAGAWALGAQISLLAKADASSVCFRHGDTANLRYMPAAGEVYSGRQRVRFFVPFSKIPVGITRVDCIGGTYMVRGEGRIIKETTNLDSSDILLTLHQNGLEVRVVNNEMFNCTDNIPVSVAGYIKVRFVDASLE